jgi:hypothetical protein
LAKLPSRDRFMRSLKIGERFTLTICFIFFQKEEKAKADLLLSANVNKNDKAKIGSYMKFFANGGFSIGISGVAAGDWLDMIPNAVVSNVADMADVKTGGYIKLVAHHILYRRAVLRRRHIFISRSL